MKSVLAGLLFLLNAKFAIAQGNLVVNGGFNGATGWVITNGAFYQSIQGNPDGCVVLDSVSPSASTDPSATQTVTGLTPGAAYAVSGQYAISKDRGSGPYTNTSFGMTIGGSVMFEALAPTNMAWRTFAFSYTATSPTATITLSSQINGTGQSYYIDNVAVQPFPSLAGTLVGTNMVLIWPTNVQGFVLQSSTNLSNLSGWLNVANSVVVAGSNRTVSVSASRPAQYFRLRL